MPKRILKLVLALAALLVLQTLSARAQAVGPVPPPPKFEVKNIGTVPTPPAPPLPPEQIIQQFTQHEDATKQLYNSYTFRETVRIDEQIGGQSDASAENTLPGEFSVTGQVYTKPGGQRFERILSGPVSTTRTAAFSMEDVKAIASLPLFVLTTDELFHYSITYEGKEKLDEIGTYIFRVKPKSVDRSHPRFDGVIWVDDHDLAIVKTYGQFVTEIAGENGTGLPFKFFETYRENIVPKFWFPTYLRSEGTVTSEKEGPEKDKLSVTLRLVVKSSDFRPQSGAQPQGAPPVQGPTQNPPAPAPNRSPQSPADRQK